MSNENQINAISVNFTRFPHNLLIPSIENMISFQAMNLFKSEEKFLFKIMGENLNLKIPEELENEIQFNANEMKEFNISLTPLSDGYGKFTIAIDWLKLVEYIVKVKRIRDEVPKSKLKKILKKYSMKFQLEKDDYKCEDYITPMSSKEIKNYKNQLKEKRAAYNEYLSLKKEWQEKKAQGIEVNEPVLEVSEKDVNNILIKLAKGYLGNKDIDDALEIALQISDDEEKIHTYHDLIRACGSFNLDHAIEIIKSLPESGKKDELIKKLALDQIDLDPEQAPRIAYLITDPSLRENLIINMIGKTIDQDIVLSLQISQLIEDESKRIKILFNILEVVNKKDNRDKAIEIINKIIEIIEKSSELKLDENDFKNEQYDFYKDAINLLAELDSPQVADALLTKFELRNAKDKVAEDLFDIIYVMVDETRTKFEPTPVFSQYYLFNAFTSNINENIKSFSKIGGNVSNNILSNEFNFNLMYISLFGYDFSIFPLLDRLYGDLKFNNSKSISYYIFPSKTLQTEEELKIVSNTLKQFGVTDYDLHKNNQILLFNLDFIPYLGKPTAILSSEQSISQDIYSQLKNALGDNVNIKFDDSLFKGGKINEYLTQIFPTSPIINLILSYEFINNYDIFKQFTLSLI
ncbi:MAG: hypothetical protein EU539_06485 [Promethearchaeota archaeon]|nr:MAG: hypothetical protein EU539_06485 [Candidatus Lokiarchaeota archaeon]